MKFNLRLIALLIAMLMLLTSCESVIEPLLGLIPGLQTGTTETTSTTTTGKPAPSKPKFNRYKHSLTQAELLEKYTLTDEYVNETLALLDEMVELSKTASSIEEVDVIYEKFEDRFYHIAQQMTIASVLYYCDMSDYRSTNRHLKTTELFYDLQDRYTQSCREIYNNSPFADELFADWSEEEIQELRDYDPTTVALRKEIEALQVDYNNLSEEEKADGAASIYAQIVSKSNELAILSGYDNYYDYASENVYGREYGREELSRFQDYVIQYILPYFDTLNNGWESLYSLPLDEKNLAISFLTSKFDAMEENYLLEYLDSLEGVMGDSMRHMFENKNCIFAGSPTSHPSAFQTYLYEDEMPFCLFGSKGQLSTTMVHEIGHYYASLANNDLSNYDLCETHSQGNEFLFIDYCAEKLPEGVHKAVRAYQLFNTYYIIIMATIIDEFEQRIYALESVEGYTSEDFDAIMTDVCQRYGGAEWLTDNLYDPYEYWRLVAVDNPVYYVSYAVSAISSIEILGLVESNRDQAYTVYTNLVEGVTAQDGFINALNKAGLTSPFEEETFKTIESIIAK